MKSQKVKFTFSVILWEDYLGDNPKIVFRKTVKITRADRNTAIDYVRKLYPLPYETELQSTEVVKTKKQS